jgi:hypothetical protein
VGNRTLLASLPFFKPNSHELGLPQHTPINSLKGRTGIRRSNSKACFWAGSIRSIGIPSHAPMLRMFLRRNQKILSRIARSSRLNFKERFSGVLSPLGSHRENPKP